MAVVGSMTPRWMRWMSFEVALRLCGYGIAIHLGLSDYDRMYSLRINVLRWYVMAAMDARPRETRTTPFISYGRSCW